jgi:sugar phosphate isomerase/epimerase
LGDYSVMRPRRFSLAHLTILDASPPELIRIAARAGYDFVGLRLIPLGLPGEMAYEPHKDATMRRDIQAAIADTGVQILDVELARIIESPTPDTYLPALETAAELGAKHVLSSVWMRDRHQVIERFAQLCEVAQPLGLTVNLEFVSSTDWSTLEGALDIVTNCGCDNVGIMIDTLHWHRGRIPLEQLDRVPPSWANFVHVCDDRPDAPATIEEARRTMREERLYPGEGAVDIARILGRLPQSVICAIELPHRQRLHELGPDRFARTCLERTKHYLSIADAADLEHH